MYLAERFKCEPNISAWGKNEVPWMSSQNVISNLSKRFLFVSKVKRISPVVGAIDEKSGGRSFSGQREHLYKFNISK